MKKSRKFNSKGQMNMSFGMIFAIIAGAFILALAIYIVVKFSGTATTKIEGEASKTIGILTNPLESSFESSQTLTINSPNEMRIYTGCEFKEPEVQANYDLIGPIPEVNPTNFQGNPGEILLIDDIFIYSEGSADKPGFKFWDRGYLSDFPQNWKEPYDYENGRVELRFEVLSQPTYTPSNLQFGIWQNEANENNCKRETMSSTVTLNGPGDIKYSSQTPSTWWEAGTSANHDTDELVDWSDVSSFCRVGAPLWSNSNPRLLVSQINGDDDWERRQEYMPMVVRVSVVMVPQGVSFSGWDDWINPTDADDFVGFSTDDEYFGKQKLNTSQYIRNSWTEASIDVSFRNKYIFSNNPSQGKKFYVFSKPFYFPYKVADLIYILSNDKTYCFVDADEIRGGDLEDEIKNLNQPSLKVNMDECPENGINVCFYSPSSNCDINIYYQNGYLTKDWDPGERYYFGDDSLMFAAIFTDKPTYECQVARLIQRAEALSDLYRKKQETLIEYSECDSELSGDLMIFNSILKSHKYPEQHSSILPQLRDASNSLDFENKWAECPLW